MEPNTQIAETTVSPAALPADFDIHKWAQDQDAGTTETQTETKPEPTTKPEAEGAKPEATQAEKKAEDTKPEADAPAGEQAKPEQGKPQSEFEKARKESERRDRSWKALEQEKSQFREEKAALQAELQGLRREVAQVKAAKEPRRDQHGATSETYDRLAKRYEDEGKDEMAQLARERAESLRRQTPVDQPAPFQSPEFQQEWQRHTQELIQAEPALADQANPLVKAANALLADKNWSGFFTHRPDGIRAAVEVARILRKGAEVDAIAKERDSLKAEVERLNKLTTLRGSPPGGPARGAKGLHEMNDEEAHAEIVRLAHAADRGEAAA